LGRDAGQVAEDKTDRTAEDEVFLLATGAIMLSFAFENAAPFGEVMFKIVGLSVNARSFGKEGLTEWEVCQFHGLLGGGLTDAGEVAMEGVTLFEQICSVRSPFNKLHLDFNSGQ
jgi:hypothetical protein